MNGILMISKFFEVIIMDIQLKISEKTFKTFSDCCEFAGTNYETELIKFIEKTVNSFELYQKKYENEKSNDLIKSKYKKNSKKNLKQSNQKSKKEKYIYLTKYGTYKIQKTINRKDIGFGTYKSLEEAVEIRNELINNDWNKNKLESIRNKLNTD